MARAASSSSSVSPSLDLDQSRGPDAVPAWQKKPQRGKAAAQRQTDPYLKGMSSKMTAGYSDYQPWQRTNSALNSRGNIQRNETISSNQSRPDSRKTNSSSGRSYGKFVDSEVIVRPMSTMTDRTDRTNCSSVCRHPWIKHNKVNKDKLTPAQRKRLENAMTIHKLQLKMRLQAIEDYKKRYTELLQENIRIREGIVASETTVHGDVQGLLHKYEKFRGAMYTLDKKFKQNLDVARKKYRDAKKAKDTELRDLKSEVSALDACLTDRQEEVKTLLNYKDKEYPEKALHISKLKRQKEDLEALFKEELQELISIIEAERNKLLTQTQQLQHNITQQVTESAIDSMPRHLKDMAMQNMIMKKEIEIHQKENESLEESIKVLEDEIRKLLPERDLNAQACLFPNLFKMQEKCTSDMDVILDIPMQKTLPI